MATQDEFIREVDEEYRRDQVMQIWKRYSGVIVAVLVLIVAAVGGWRYWQVHQQRQSEAAAARYQEAIRLAQEGKGEDAQAALNAAATDSPAGYALLSRFRLAAELGRTNATEGAQAFEGLAADTNVAPVWRDLARLKALMLKFDTAEPAAIRPELERLAAPEQVWRHTARELLGLSGLKSGDYEFASRWFDRIAGDRETPAALRQRLEVYSALVAGGPVKAAAP
jgi:hypothetical protein